MPLLLTLWQSNGGKRAEEACESARADKPFMQAKSNPGLRADSPVRVLDATNGQEVRSSAGAAVQHTRVTIIVDFIDMITLGSVSFPQGVSRCWCDDSKGVHLDQAGEEEARARQSGSGLSTQQDIGSRILAG
jgi:hypothetical protein